jgi:hypothetical protein
MKRLIIAALALLSAGTIKAQAYPIDYIADKYTWGTRHSDGIMHWEGELKNSGVHIHMLNQKVSVTGCQRPFTLTLGVLIRDDYNDAGSTYPAFHTLEFKARDEHNRNCLFRWHLYDDGNQQIIVEYNDWGILYAIAGSPPDRTSDLSNILPR